MVVVKNISIVVKLIANHNALLQQSVANFSEIVKGFGMLPDKDIDDFARGYLGALLAKYDSSS